MLRARGNGPEPVSSENPEDDLQALREGVMERAYMVGIAISMHHQGDWRLTMPKDNKERAALIGALMMTTAFAEGMIGYI